MVFRAALQKLIQMSDRQGRKNTFLFFFLFFYGHMKHISAVLTYFHPICLLLPLTCYILNKLLILPPGLRACSNESGGPRRGEAPHLPAVEKNLSSHATPGTQA